MRLVCVLSIFENNWGRTDRPTDGRTDTTSYRDATAHLKMNMTEEPFRLYNHDEYNPIFGHQARDFLGKTINLIKHHKQTIWEKPGAAPFSPFSPRYVVG